MAADIASAHHERFDGRGYPNGLSGAQIPLAARILSVADVFDALTSKRVYRDAFEVSEAARMMRQEMAGHFDPVIMATFDRRFEDLRQAHSRFSIDVAMYGTKAPAPTFHDGLNEWSVGAISPSRSICSI
jgi:putative two-component system response regulator